MEAIETFSKTNTQTRLLQDTEYYKYIFKKTEKIACAVFFILRGNKDTDRTDVVVSELEQSAQRLSDSSLASLRSTATDAGSVALEVSYALLTLESKLRIANASRVLATEYLEVFVNEIDAVQRSLRRYISSGIENPLLSADTVHGERPLRRERRAPERLGGATPGPNTQPGAGRRERVIAVIRDKGEASIKDIVEVVTDCSEKTIQRELNALIKDNIVHREGERRWSKYKLV